MGAIQRAVRRALNPISTRLTMLVQGAATRRLPRGFATFSPTPAGWLLSKRGRGRWGSFGRKARPIMNAGGQVVVPDVIGLGWDDARAVLHRFRLVAVGPDPDEPPLAALGWPDGVVVDQRPEPGAVLPVGSPVMVWIERGPGSAGVREPRRPHPSPRRAAGMVDEQTDEVVG